MKVVRLILGLVLIASAPWLGAATHPVPLDKNTPSAKCIECHEDKAKGKNVHSAIAMGCTSCHEIRVNKDVTRVKLITSTPQALCITCHADKNAADLKGKSILRECAIALSATTRTSPTTSSSCCCRPPAIRARTFA